MENLKNKTEYTLVQKEQEMQEKTRSLESKRARDAQAAAERYESIVTKLGETHRFMDEDLKRITSGTEREMKDKDRAFEQTLAQEYETQGQLLSTLQAERNAHDKAVKEMEDKYLKRFKQVQDNEDAAMSEWRSEYDKVCDLLKMDGMKFEVALLQTDEEYRVELQQLKAKQEQALQSEDDRCTAALKECVSYKQNMQIMESLIRTREEELREVKRELSGLQSQLKQSQETFRDALLELKAKEEAIKARDQSIAKLRDSQKHLEGFRYVLFHKVRDLEDERGPLGSQVESLHESVAEMDAEFVRAFRSKRHLEHRLRELTAQVSGLQDAAQDARGSTVLATKETHKMYDELTEVLYEHDMAQLKKRLEGFMARYDRFRNPAGGPDPGKIAAIADEVEAQRRALKKKATRMLEENEQVKKDRMNTMGAMVRRNCGLIDDCERLRTERRNYERTNNTLQERLVEPNNTRSRERRRKADLSGVSESLEGHMQAAAAEAQGLRDISGSLPLIAGAEPADDGHP
jgi:hypothetical protein